MAEKTTAKDTKNFDYYVKKTKERDARLKNSPEGRARAAKGNNAAYFLTLGLQVLVMRIVRIAVVVLAVISLIVSFAARAQASTVNEPLFALFTMITIAVPVLSFVSYWVDGAIVVAIVTVAFGIFACTMPFYGEAPQGCGPDYDCIVDLSREPQKNLYGIKLGSGR